jgi:hypothetical protein
MQIPTNSTISTISCHFQEELSKIEGASFPQMICHVIYIRSSFPTSENDIYTGNNLQLFVVLGGDDVRISNSLYVPEFLLSELDNARIAMVNADVRRELGWR